MGKGQMGKGQMGWFRDTREAQEAQALLANWEVKRVLVYWNPLTQAWEVKDKQGQRFADKEAAIASQRRDGWEVDEVMEDGWVALPPDVEAAYESRVGAAAYTVFFRRRRH